VSDGDRQSADLDRYVPQSFALHPAVKITATSALVGQQSGYALHAAVARPSNCQYMLPLSANVAHRLLQVK
jgi:hypothetical protein